MDAAPGFADVAAGLFFTAGVVDVDLFAGLVAGGLLVGRDVLPPMVPPPVTPPSCCPTATLAQTNTNMSVNTK